MPFILLCMPQSFPSLHWDNLQSKASDDIPTRMYTKLPQGVEYLSKEKARLEKLLAGGSVAAAKVDEMSRKTSVLGAFLDDE